MTTSRFTLICFHCHLIDLQDSMREPTELAQILDATSEHRVEIYLGAYVFDTRKGWQNMHRLCEFLRNHRRSVVRLPFEAELFAYTAPEVGKKLEALGVTLYPYPEKDR
jgi:hypothetical protein